jgi:hypothetical protein
MALLVPNNGEGDGLEAFVAKSAATALILCLFKSNTTPAETDTTATYTEADFTGYSNISLTGASWGSPSEGAPSSIAYAQQTFTSSAGSQNQDVYGYFMKRTTSGRIALAERFSDGPYNIANNGDAIKVTPSITLD